MPSIRTLELFSIMTVAATLSACGGCGEDVNPSVDPYFEPLEYGAWAPTRVPDISAPDEVLFGDVAVGDSTTVTFEVRNVGRALLKFDSWELDGPDFSIDFPQFMGNSLPTRLEPGASVLVAATFTARVEEGTIGRLTIVSDDPDEEVTVVEFLGNIKRPCLAIVPDNGIDFGVQDLNETASRTMRLVSCSPNADTVVDLSFDGGRTGAFVSDGRNELVLRPGEEANIEVLFTPPEPGRYEASWSIVTNEEDENTYEVPIQGEGAPYECPEAVMVASAPGRTAGVADPEGSFAGVPLDVVRFDAERSRAFDGAEIVDYEWSIIQRPSDSTASFNGANNEESSLFLDLSGDYIIELDVIDSRGTRSCRPARLAMTAIPDEDIHVQLVWDTPNDNNQLDGVGSDVDVHLLHPSGRWNERPYDCFWQNLEPDWGVQGRPGDNPSLDIDDVDGSGPENINYDNPTTGLRYGVGVHYFSDHGYGSSYVTLRIYLGGTLHTELQRKRMSDQQFWHALDIEWPEQTVSEIDRTYNSIPSSF